MGSFNEDFVKTTNLPSSDSSHLILSPATVAEQVQAWKINEPAWRGIFSTEQYLARERHLSQQRLTKDGQITYWILTTADGKPDQRPIYSACESFRKIGLVVRPGSKHVEEVIAHGVGSVFCRPEYRGRGYAGRMMKELAQKMDQGWQQPSGHPPSFSILYSDIGQKFYNDFGWKPYPSTHITFDPISEETYTETVKRLDLPAPIDITTSDLEPEICPRDVDQMKERILSLAEKSNDPAKTFIAIRPDYEHISWHHAREEFHALATQQDFPKIKGAAVPSYHSSSSSSVLPPTLIWTRSYGSTPDHFILNALRLIHPSSSSSSSSSRSHSDLKAITSLLLRAQLEAERSGMKAFEIWSPSKITIQAASILKGFEEEEHDPHLDIVIKREKESICSLRWIGGGDDDDDDDDDGDKGTQEIVWIGNEKYAWC
ncbi:putative gnat family acetyltransferase [Phaeomoniella chlamydospora]|uniref:Putative gnat family acetyltransferase n=1 Tax=Phaeomoniella chlamydospora TaxID=158046 RepID=A0A0G2FQZ9_PHACM|nr:putative gnat family acetyltransferase [Phaeomoniella chlamydospora]